MRDEFIRKAVVTKVYNNGDSLIVDLDLGFNITKTSQKIKLARIDTPKSRGSKEKPVYASVKALALDIQQWMEELLTGNTIYIQSLEKTSFDRLVCDAYINVNDKFINLNQYMIDNGIAREYHDEFSEEFGENWDLLWFEDIGKDKFLKWKESDDLK